MVDFPNRIEPTRRNVREILGSRSYDASILDDWPVLVRPVTGQQSPNDSAFRGENLDLLINEFVTRLKTPGSQVSAPALQTLVSTVTEMVGVLSKGSPQPLPTGQSSFAPNAPILPQQAWQPSQPQDIPVYTPLRNGNNEGYIGSNETSFSSFNSGTEDFPSAWDTGDSQNWYGGEDTTSYQGSEYGLDGRQWGASEYSSFSERTSYSAFENPNGNIYFPQPEYAYSTPENEQNAALEEDKLAPVQGIKREFVPQGIPVSFFAQDEDYDLEEEPTLFDFVSALPQNTHATGY